ncbi:MAG: creatininase family protein [Ruminiclostridium sp.]
MSYSIFKHTMVDMTYPKIEEVIAKDGCVLLPVSVVEEHGPHLCTGTDIYLTQAVCEKITLRMTELGVETVIAPPFYWGVNSITNGFTGSFEIKPDTMITLLLEILENLNKWGFHKIFLLNFHGDFVHIKTVAEAVCRAYTEKSIGAYFVNDANLFHQLGFIQSQPYLLKVPMNTSSENIQPQYIDIHAGALETSWMIHGFKELVNIPLAHTLQPSNTTARDLGQWVRGGEDAKRITPLGYCGNPADVDLENISLVEKNTVEAYSQSIIDFLNHIK